MLFHISLMSINNKDKNLPVLQASTAAEEDYGCTDGKTAPREWLNTWIPVWLISSLSH